MENETVAPPVMITEKGEKKLIKSDLNKYKINFTNTDRNIILSSASIDFPYFLITKSLSKKIFFATRIFFDYVMDNKDILSEKQIINLSNRFKTKIKFIHSDNTALLFELRLYFSFGVIYSMEKKIDAVSLYAFIKFVTHKSKYLFILLNYIMYVFLVRVDTTTMPKISDDEIKKLNEIISTNCHLMRVTVDDKKLRSLFMNMLYKRTQVTNIPKVDRNHWAYKNPFEWLINENKTKKGIR